jgi:hypothetical protein
MGDLDLRRRPAVEQGQHGGEGTRNRGDSPR